ncbi:iron-hydroxamate ABC transporter substrate-binding protein [Cohnella rhizosphaerae]|uniref:Iron-hydroxamate ABC transporter substrate-binding protein n=1 Tax=Cohnella rhizosphaerae TaxID=1457232 RepID=A0A9X4QUF2_9BACL|nr:iron-hydroxamate ABC transporter substrate-binding protein [Cohnella rhizosphaerae]MDG0811424.1 iron-hydroxamate ABC transporter substrate-binding protein [Cohnella rhizosphaerae]
MKRKMWAPLFLLLALVVSACGNNANNNNAGASQSAGASASPSASAPAAPSADASASAEASGTIAYESENGPVEVPAAPKRIIALNSAPNVLSLGGTLVGVDQWTAGNPLFKDKVKGIEVVSAEDLEKIIELNPDLIIVGSTEKNIDKLKEIAPTVVYTWGKLDYLKQQIEIGKLLNKEQEAQAWADDFSKRAADIGAEIKAQAGADVTVTVFELYDKQFYVFGNNWARGTEIVYQAMGLGMPEKVKKDALGPGYYTLSTEVLPEYAGDYIILSRSAAGDNAALNTDTWKNMPAVKAGHVIEIDTEASSYSDPTTLEYLLNIFKAGMLGKA